MNEPVAWMQMRDDGTVAKYSPVKTWEDDIPLYTRPSKQLSDDILMKLYDVSAYPSEIYLRKAQAIIKEITE